MARNRHWLLWLRRRFREAVRDNNWVLPVMGAIAGVLLARIVGTGGGVEDGGWTVSVDRSRDLLFGFLALLFTALSIVLALAAVATQNVVARFGSRTLRLYFRRSVERWLLGTFTLATAFIMTEQFQLRKLDPDAPAPEAGASISLVLLIVAGSAIVSYVAVVMRWFRVDIAVRFLRRAVLEAAHEVARTRWAGPESVPIPQRPANATDLLAPRSGKLAEIDADRLLELCRPLNAIAVITETLGADVVKDQPLGWIAGDGSEIESIPVREIADTIDVSATRELEQNIEYGIVAMVDIAIIALSPAANDPNAAVEVIEEMGSLFSELSTQTLGPRAAPDGDSWPRVVVRARTFGELVEVATTQIVLYGVSDPMVLRSLRRMADSLRLLELSDDDLRHVEEFAAKLIGSSVDRVGTRQWDRLPSGDDLP
jgi:uncharacterized membrane protein